MCARVAQWWSIALPRRGSRVRIPSRAFNDTKKGDIRWIPPFLYVRALPGSNSSNVSAPLRSSQVNVPRTFCDVSCSQRDRKKSHPMDGSFLYVRALPGSNGSNVGVPLRSSQQFQMLVNHRIAWYDKICSEMLAECISRNCRQHAIEFMHEGHTLKKV